jgi:hypothetical protein
MTNVKGVARFLDSMIFPGGSFPALRAGAGREKKSLKGNHNIMMKRRDFVLKVVPLVGGVTMAPRVAFAEVPALAEDDKMAIAMGFRLQTERADQAKYPKHTNEQNCAKCLHYGTANAEMARCDLFNKMVPKGAWCSGYSRRA